MRFVEYQRPNGDAVAHIAQAHVTTTERLFLREHALTFPALNDQPNIHKPDRILIGARVVWEVVAHELEGALLAGKLAGREKSEAARLVHEIRLAVLRNRFHYHGIG